MFRKQKELQTTGFTLVEVMVAVFVFSVLTGGVAIFSAYYFKNYSFSFEENQSISIAQTGITKMIREIRETRSGDDGSWPIVDAQDNTFTFYSDVTNDGRTDKVRYFLNGTTLQRGVIEPAGVPVGYPPASEKITTVATSIDTSAGPLFRYYNGNWPADQIYNPITSSDRLLQTRYVTVYLRINISPNFASLPFEITSGVTIRSMKTNL
jgi:prepilin-type N-terminal cleavage/methylation domain-containing protein